MKQLLIFMVRAYQATLGPLLGGACRFHPTCSAYAVEAIERHGAARGGWLAAKRLAKCHPFGAGGYDPAPSETVDCISVFAANVHPLPMNAQQAARGKAVASHRTPRGAQ